jgi:TolA-binding protein
MSLLKIQLPVRLSPASYVFAGALVIQLIVLFRVADSPLLLPKQGDMAFYNDWARRILAGKAVEHLAFYGLPGYAYWLSAIYCLFGYNPFSPLFIQACANAGTSGLLYKISARLFPNSEEIRGRVSTIGLLAAVGWVFFEPAQAYGAILMPTALSVFALWLVVWQIVRHDQLPGYLFFVLLGCLIGISATMVATILFVLPLVIGACFWKWRAIGSPWRVWTMRFLCTGCLLGGVGAGTGPCWIHNYFYARDPVILSAHSGFNFWIGNNPIAIGYPRFPNWLRAGQESMLEDSIRLAEHAAGHRLKRSEVSAYWSSNATDYIKGHFSAWLRLLGVKIGNFWSAFQYDDLSIITILRDEHVIFPGIRFGLVAVLAVAAFVFAVMETPAACWVAGAVILQMCGLLPVFVTERYRLAAVPGLLVFAAFGLWWFARHLSQPRYLIMFGLALVSGTAVVARPVTEPTLWALDAYNYGIMALDLHQYDLAEKRLTRAYYYSPQNSEVNFAMGNLRLTQNKKPEAEGFYLQAISLNPNHKGALNNLGYLTLTEKRWNEAEYFFRQALQRDPGEATTHFLLAQVLFAKGDRPGAAMEANRALALNPTQTDFIALREQIARP